LLIWNQSRRKSRNAAGFRKKTKHGKSYCNNRGNRLYFRGKCTGKKGAGVFRRRGFGQFLRLARTVSDRRCHSAGVLRGNVAEQVYPEIVAAKAHCFPNEAYVEFLGINNCEQHAIAGAVKKSIESELGISVFEREFYNLPHAILFREQFRIVQIGKHNPIPCGGTNLASTASVENFTVTKIKNRKGNRRMPFAIT
jgi:hypothetical protein